MLILATFVHEWTEWTIDFCFRGQQRDAPMKIYETFAVERDRMLYHHAPAKSCYALPPQQMYTFMKAAFKDAFTMIQSSLPAGSGVALLPFAHKADVLRKDSKMAKNKWESDIRKWRRKRTHLETEKNVRLSILKEDIKEFQKSFKEDNVEKLQKRTIQQLERFLDIFANVFANGSALEQYEKVQRLEVQRLVFSLLHVLLSRNEEMMKRFGPQVVNIASFPQRQINEEITINEEIAGLKQRIHLQRQQPRPKLASVGEPLSEIHWIACSLLQQDAASILAAQTCGWMAQFFFWSLQQNDAKVAALLKPPAEFQAAKESIGQIQAFCSAREDQPHQEAGIKFATSRYPKDHILTPEQVGWKHVFEQGLMDRETKIVFFHLGQVLLHVDWDYVYGNKKKFQSFATKQNKDRIINVQSVTPILRRIHQRSQKNDDEGQDNAKDILCACKEVAEQFKFLRRRNLLPNHDNPVAQAYHEHSRLQSFFFQTVLGKTAVVTADKSWPRGAQDRLQKAMEVDDVVGLQHIAMQRQRKRMQEVNEYQRITGPSAAATSTKKKLAKAARQIADLVVASVPSLKGDPTAVKFVDPSGVIASNL